jgi:hypothetical protein
MNCERLLKWWGRLIIELSVWTEARLRALPPQAVFAPAFMPGLRSGAVEWFSSKVFSPVEARLRAFSL